MGAWAIMTIPRYGLTNGSAAPGRAPQPNVPLPDYGGSGYPMYPHTTSMSRRQRPADICAPLGRGHTDVSEIPKSVRRGRAGRSL
eukprot:12607858-Heterocapsa_arctica.AAC.1